MASPIGGWRSRRRRSGSPRSSPGWCPAVLHARAPTAAETNWAQIVGLYAALLTHLPTPVVRMNAAVAESMLRGPEAGLVWIDRLLEDAELGRA